MLDAGQDHGDSRHAQGPGARRCRRWGTCVPTCLPTPRKTISAGAAWEARQAPRGRAGRECCQRRARLRAVRPPPPLRAKHRAVPGGIKRAPWPPAPVGSSEPGQLVLSPASPSPCINALPGIGSTGAAEGSGAHRGGLATPHPARGSRWEERRRDRSESYRAPASPQPSRRLQPRQEPLPPCRVPTAPPAQRWGRSP